MVAFIEPKKLDADEIEEAVVENTNHHIGRILFRAGKSIPPVVQELIKREMWFLAENIMKDGLGVPLTKRVQKKNRPFERSNSDTEQKVK